MISYHARQWQVAGVLLGLPAAAAVCAVPLFDSDSSAFVVVLAGILVVACLTALAMMGPRLVRGEAELAITDDGFRYRGYPFVAWDHIAHLRKRDTRVLGLRHRCVEVSVHDPQRLWALSSIPARVAQYYHQLAEQPPLVITHGFLPVTLDVVVADMVRVHPTLIVASGPDPTDDHGTALPQLEQALVDLLVQTLPDEWQAAALWFMVVGDTRHAGIHLRVSGQAEETVRTLQPAPELLTLLTQLKDRCYEPTKGTWLSGFITVEGDRDNFRSELSYDAIPTWSPKPTAEELRRELARFPRQPQSVPPWITHALATE